MVGPTGQTTKQYVIPVGEGHKVYSPAMLAWEIRNFILDTDGVLRSLHGPCPYEPDRGEGFPAYGRWHGIYHDHPTDCLYIRTGESLRRHTGWASGWETLQAGLSDDANPHFPDQFCAINGNVVWSNGVDKARVIVPDGTLYVLGFGETPSAPTVLSPTHIDAENITRQTLYPNNSGYTFPGRCGTVGDEISRVEGKLLAGSWYYHVQLEDAFGNLSALSPASNAASVFAQSTVVDSTATPPILEEVDDLLRHFLVRAGGQCSENTVAVRLYRTPDTRNFGVTPMLVDRWVGSEQFVYPDPHADSELGPEAESYVAVPTFKVMTAHQGRLVIGNLGGDPGMVRISDVAFPGSFKRDWWVVPDSGGAEITGMVSYRGQLMVFTAGSTYLLTVTDQGIVPQPLFETVGCVGPNTIQTRGDGMLIWLAFDGCYGYKGGELLKLSSDIQDDFDRGLNTSRLRLAVSAIDKAHDLYLCALTSTGTRNQDVMIGFNGMGFQRYGMDICVDAMCTTKDWRRYVLMGGVDEAQDGNNKKNLWVWDHEYEDWTPPDRSYVFTSSWIRNDETGLRPMRVRKLYIKLIESYDGPLTVTFYKDGVRTPLAVTVPARMVSDEFVAGHKTAGAAVVGTETMRQSPEIWRTVPCPPELDTCRQFAFTLSAKLPADVRIAGFAFDIAPVGNGQSLGRLDGTGY